MRFCCLLTENNIELTDETWQPKTKQNAQKSKYDCRNFILLNMYPQLRNCPLRWTASQLVVHEPLGVLPLAVSVVLVAAVPDDVRHDAEERQLLVELNNRQFGSGGKFGIEKKNRNKKGFCSFCKSLFANPFASLTTSPPFFVAERPMSKRYSIRPEQLFLRPRPLSRLWEQILPSLPGVSTWEASL